MLPAMGISNIHLIKKTKANTVLRKSYASCKSKLANEVIAWMSSLKMDCRLTISMMAEKTSWLLVVCTAYMKKILLYFTNNDNFGRYILFFLYISIKKNHAGDTNNLKASMNALKFYFIFIFALECSTSCFWKSKF